MYLYFTVNALSTGSKYVLSTHHQLDDIGKVRRLNTSLDTLLPVKPKTQTRRRRPHPRGKEMSDIMCLFPVIDRGPVPSSQDEAVSAWGERSLSRWCQRIKYMKTLMYSSLRVPE